MREDGRKRFAKEIKERVEGLRGAVRSVKGELLGKGAYTYRTVLDMLNRVFRRLDARVLRHQAHARHPQPARELQGRHRVGPHLVRAAVPLFRPRAR